MAKADRSSLIRWGRAGLIFFGVTALGTLWWEHGGHQAYGGFFGWVAPRVYGLLGFEEVLIGPRERFIHLVPFVGLMAATPGLPARRRFGGMAAGIVTLFVWQLLASFMIGWQFRALISFPLSLAVVSDVLPFVLWVYFAREVLSEWRGRLGPPAPGA